MANRDQKNRPHKSNQTKFRLHEPKQRKVKPKKDSSHKRQFIDKDERIFRNEDDE